MKKTLTLFMKGLSLSAIVLSVCLAVPTTVKAASLNIDDTSPNGTITVSWNFSDGPAGQQFWLGQGINNGWVGPVGSTTFSEAGGQLHFAGNWGETLPVPPSGPPQVNVYFTEANDPTLVSDILSYSYAYATINGHTYQSMIGSFQSFLVDVPLGQYTLLPPDILLSEAAGPFLWPQTGGSEPLGGGCQRGCQLPHCPRAHDDDRRCAAAAAAWGEHAAASAQAAIGVKVEPVGVSQLSPAQR